MKTTPKLILPLLILISAAFFTPAAAIAQQALGLTAIPPRLDITVKPGETVTKEIKVRNDSAVDRSIITTPKDFIVTDDKGTPVQIEGVNDSSNRWASSSWIQISPSSFTLKPGETKILMLTVIAPENPTAGGHYAMVLHSPKNEVTLNETGSKIQTYVGTLVYITVPGDMKENAMVREFSSPTFLEFGPVNFKTIIANYSDIHITPTGSINIKNWLGGRTASLGINGVNIFPGTTREYQNTLDRRFLLGRYVATLEAGYGTTGQALTAAIIFWVIPWRLILLVIAVIIITIILTLLLRQKTTSGGTENQKVEELEQELENLKKKYQDRK